MSDDKPADTPVTAADLASARGRLGEQVTAMEREFARLGEQGEEVPPLALEMISRLRALAEALDGLEAALVKPESQPVEPEPPKE